MISLVFLFGSLPTGGRGGASTVINSYIDFFKRNDSIFEVTFIPFHSTSISRSFKILRYLPSFLIGYRLFKNIFFAKRLFNRSTRYAYWHSYGVLDSFLLLILSPLISIFCRHRIVTLHCPNFYPINSVHSISQNLYYAFINMSGFKQHHLNEFHFKSWQTNYNKLKFLSTRSSRHFVCLNPLSNTLSSRLSAFEKTPKNNVNNLNSNVNILSLSQLIPGKNIHLLVEAISFLPNNFKLTIAGDGPYDYKLFLEKCVASLNLEERVNFVGFLDDYLKQAYFESADVFCVPSTSDTQSLVNIEAIASNVPIVLVKYPPFLEIYSNIPSIFWAEDFSAKELSNQLSRAAVYSNLLGLDKSKKVLLHKFSDKNLLAKLIN